MCLTKCYTIETVLFNIPQFPSTDKDGWHAVRGVIIYMYCLPFVLVKYRTKHQSAFTQNHVINISHRSTSSLKGHRVLYHQLDLVIWTHLYMKGKFVEGLTTALVRNNAFKYLWLTINIMTMCLFLHNVNITIEWNYQYILVHDISFILVIYP